MAINNVPEQAVAEQRQLDTAFSALTKTFGPVVRISDPSAPTDFWPLRSPARCDHNWPGDLGEQDACCDRCGLGYAEWSVD